MAPFDRPVRIANCSGFYGDRLSAAREMVLGGPIDVLSGDWLAELTMLILVRERMKSPEGGFARTFVKQVTDVLAAALDRGVRIVSNAGGVNPDGLGAAIAAVGVKLGRTPKIAIVDGDEVLGLVQGWNDRGELKHLERGAPLGPSDGMPMAANAYLGAWGIAEALRAGADIVITGRVTDAALVVGPAAWAHGWAVDAWDALAGALVAGHIIECGAQATGGNYAFFEEVPGLEHPGFPIAEIAADGAAVITKHPGTGGRVSVGTVTAQLLYEIGSPLYASPDVIARFETIRLEAEGPDRVAVRGVKGEPPTDRLKAGVLCMAGWRNEVTLQVGGGSIPEKAALLKRTFWANVGGEERFQTTHTAVIRGDHPETPPALRLSRVIFSARDPDRDKVGKAFASKAVELALCSVPGLTLEGLPEDPRPVGVFWPCLVPRAEVPHRVRLGDQAWTPAEPPTAPWPALAAAPAEPGVDTSAWTVEAPLGALAGARSGDKAGLANVGFWVRDPAHLGWLMATVTEANLRRWLGFEGPIRIWPLPNLLAINVELVGWLADGVAGNLHPDPQAKCLAENLRGVTVPVDPRWLTR